MEHTSDYSRGYSVPTTTMSMSSSSQRQSSPNRNRNRNRIVYSHFGYASLVIQKVFRGHRCRRILWSYGNVLYVANVVRLQKWWRGYLGRQKAIAWLQHKIGVAAHTVHGLFHRWKVRRLIRVARSEQYQRMATRIQCLFRGRAHREMVRRLRFQIKTKAATIIQKYTRRMLGIILTTELRQLLARTWQEVMNVYRASVGLIMMGKFKGIESINSEVGPWDLLHLSLSYMLAGNQPELSLILCNYMIARYPTFGEIGYIILEVALLSSWTAVTKVGLVREDFLEEAYGRMLFRQTSFQAIRATTLDSEEFPCTLPWLKLIKRASNLNTFKSAIQTLYFQNAIHRQNKSWKSLVYNATWVLVNSEGHNSKANNATMTHTRRSDLRRARRLINEAYKSTASALISRQCKEQLMIMDNIFVAQHVLLYATDTHVFSDCRLSDYLVAKFLKPQLQSCTRKGIDRILKQLNETLSAQVTATVSVYQCGDMLMIQAVVDHFTHIDIPPDVATVMREDLKLDPSLFRLHATQWRHFNDDSSNFVAPCLLLPKDAARLYDLALQYLAEKHRTPVAEVRLRGQAMNMSEYLLHVVRLVTLPSKFRISSSLGFGNNESGGDADRHADGERAAFQASASYRLTVPFVDYRRRERNDRISSDYYIKVIQRVYRGFQGRSRFRRLHTRVTERKRQITLAQRHHEEVTRVFEQRFYWASIIQAHIKGYLWRKELTILHEEALILQCFWRVLAAKKRVAAERRRKLFGPDVLRVLKDSAVIGGRHMVVTVLRCGNNYRIVGEDFINNATYEGFFYQQEVMLIISEHNQQLLQAGADALKRNLAVAPLASSASSVSSASSSLSSSAMAKAPVRLWNYDLVARMLVERAGLAKMITQGTTDLAGRQNRGNKGHNYAIVGTSTAAPSIRNVQTIVGRERTLRDGEFILARYNKLMAKRAKKAAAENGNGNGKNIDRHSSGGGNVAKPGRLQALR